MKKFYLFALAATIALFSACSSSDDVAEGTIVNPDGKGFMNVAINLPSTSDAGSRAPSVNANDDYDAGTADEYRVNNVAILLFKAPNATTSVNDATFMTAKDVTVEAWSAGNSWGGDKNITTHTQCAVELGNLNYKTTDKLYALAIINRPTNYVVSGGALTIGGTPFTSTNTFGDFCDLALSSLSDVCSSNNIMMTNAVLSNMKGADSNPEGAQVQTLAAVDQSLIKGTLAELSTIEAVELFVERVVGKVTVNEAIGTKVTNVGVTVNDGTTPTTPAAPLPYIFEGWKLENMNGKSYVVRKWDSSWLPLYNNFAIADNKYRFVGGTELKKGYSGSIISAGLWRTYFAEDFDFAGTPTNAYDETEFHPVNGNPRYCFENTFNVASMKVKNATHAVVKAKFTLPKGETEFYTKRGIVTTIYTEDGMKAEAATALFAGYSATTLAAEYTSLAGATELIVSSVVFDKTTAGTVHVQTLTVQDKTDATKQAVVAKATIIKDVNDRLGEINRYVNATAYYIVPIKHFGDEMTPWNSGESTAPSIGNDYPASSAANYLGRYGIVRNNWYDVHVTGVQYIGYPIDPSDIITGDDENIDHLQSYLKFSISILSWAKRSQDVVLQ